VRRETSVAATELHVAIPASAKGAGTRSKLQGPKAECEEALLRGPERSLLAHGAAIRPYNPS